VDSPPLTSSPDSADKGQQASVARSVRAGATAKGAFIGARAPHADVHEFGGTIRFLTRRMEIVATKPGSS